MEEDSAKMNHQGADSLAGSTHSLVDFNRAGTPLAEIVSEPDMRSGVEAAEYGRELQRVSVAPVPATHNEWGFHPSSLGSVDRGRGS